MPRKYWTIEEEELVKQGFGKKPLQALLLELPGRTKYSLLHRAHKLGVRGDGGISQAKYTYDKEFFSVISPLSSYYAGFIAADGCIYPPSNTVKITLAEKDVSVLNELKSFTQYTGSIKTHQGGSYRKESKHCSLCFYGAKQWIEDLNENFNLVQNKTLILQPPTLNEETTKAFISGYLDGDGSIYSSKTGQLSVSFRGTNEMLLWIKFFADKHAPLVKQTRQPSQVRCYDTIPEYRVSGSRALKFLGWLRSVDVPRLERKWNYEF